MMVASDLLRISFTCVTAYRVQRRVAAWLAREAVPQTRQHLTPLRLQIHI